MDSMELKNLQAPIKEKYKADPGSAIITLKAQGNIGEGISCKVDTGRALVEAGLHPATGGTGMLACSGDMLLEALVACAGVTLSAVATAIGVEIKNGIVRAEGDLDFRGTLGVSKEAQVGFKNIRLYFQIESSATAEQITSLSKLTERYCVVYQTLCNGVKVDTFYEV
ncbi:MAG: OsmC family protein [Bacteroidetes bacterium]|nr:OsmC family protein [Bacteroidota bacterium]